MSANPTANLEERLDRLESHMAEENPVLLDVVKGFRELDQAAYRLGILDRSESLATQVSWWPLISVLGTFSSGKSTFINRYLGEKVQSTGNQAVDDKFTVICYGEEDESRVLPGLALDNDPRFPFYRISHEIDAITEGEGQRLDVYLQLKTSNSEQVKAKILIDSPGFDADAQRTATLRITDQIIDLSDLVLVFFDARHPEPGAMRDTLQHLVRDTLQRPDFNKFLFILNQIDNAAREDNPEEVFAAWQRALAQNGLTAGKFYRVYDPDAADQIPDEGLRQRFEAKRQADMAEIENRMRQVEIERAYRVTGMLEETAQTIRDQVLPRLREARRSWKRRVLWLDGIVFGVIILALLYWSTLPSGPLWGLTPATDPVPFWGLVIVVLAAAGYLHHVLRRAAGRLVLRGLKGDTSLGKRGEWVVHAFRKNMRSLKPFWAKEPVGSGRFVRDTLTNILSEADRMVQSLNDRYTSPSGSEAGEAVQESRAGAAAETPASQAAASEEAEAPAPDEENKEGEEEAPARTGA